MPKNDPADEATSTETEAATAIPRKGGRKKGKKRKHNKTAYVREAIEVKGVDASNKDLMDYIKTRHRVTINSSHFSNIKSNVLKEMGSGKRQAANGAPKKAPRAASGGKTPTVEELRVVKSLLQRIGPDGLREVIALFRE